MVAAVVARAWALRRASPVKASATDGPSAGASAAAAYDPPRQYDQGGNRTLKTEYLGLGHRRETTYSYDIQDPVRYGTYHNRLMESVKEDVTSGVMESMAPGGDISSLSLSAESAGTLAFGGGGGGEIRTPLERKWYFYSEAANLERVVTRMEGGRRRPLPHGRGSDTQRPRGSATPAMGGR